MRTSSESRVRRLAIALSLVLAVVLAACTPPRPPAALDPAGPVSARVNTTVDFAPVNMQGALNWSVDGVAGGSVNLGTVADGTYQAPGRIPAGSTVTVSAAEAANPGRTASAEVAITAPGTLYVLDDAVYVFNDLDVADGNVSPNRTFTIDGVSAGPDYYDMAMAPALDMAFIGVDKAEPNVYRVANVSSADGVVTAVAFASQGHMYPAGLAYDAQRDILYVTMNYALLAYHNASTAPEGQEPDRVVEGPSLAHILLQFDVRLNLDAAADRLFVSVPDGIVAVYDQASTIDGEALPNREFEFDATETPIDFLWGAAYDATRDELYLADQSDFYNRPIMVVANASTASGTVAPDRTIGGAETAGMEPSQVGYDAANDRLIVIDSNNDDVKVFDAASTLDGDVAPTRVIGGSELPINYAFSGYLDPTQ